MLLIGFCIVFLILGIGLILGGEYERHKRDEIPDMFGYQYGGIVAVIVAIIFLTAVWPVTYLKSITKVAEMKAFYSTNLQNYQTTIEQTSQAIIFLESESALQISVENLKQSTNWSDRLWELRNRTLRYNNDFHRLRAYNDNLLLDWFYKDIPKNLKPVVLELLELKE